MSTVNIAFDAPVTRESGAALALTDIDHFSLTRNGVEIAKLAPSGPSLTAVDTSPLTGADTYNVFTITKDGLSSKASNDAVVTVPNADPASPVTTLAATLAP